jgi:RNA polymerase sigma-70 factor (ECF subfamily)
MPRSPLSSRRRTSHTAASLRRLADEELIAMVAANEATAFEIVLERHLDVAFSLAYRMVGRRQAAEDVVQEALLSVWRSGARYDRSRGSVRTWLLGIVHNRAIDMLRRHDAREALDVSDEGLEERLQAPQRTETEVARRQDAHEVRRAVSELPPEQLKVIELAFFGGFTHTEIASMLELPAGTVKGRMRLGLHKLREQLGDRQEMLQ